MVSIGVMHVIFLLTLFTVKLSRKHLTLSFECSYNLNFIYCRPV